MVCLVCHQVTPGRLCARCEGSLVRAPDRILPGGMRVVAAFAHEGAARPLAHLLKYRGVVVYADMVATATAPRLPRLPLVPIPRMLSRRFRYGVDPARLIAGRLSRLLAVPVLDCLRPPLHAPARAGRNRRSAAPAFGLRFPPPGPVIVVDDVLTTGATLLSAIAAMPPGTVRMGVVANSARVSSLSAVILPGHRDGG